MTNWNLSVLEHKATCSVCSRTEGVAMKPFAKRERAVAGNDAAAASYEGFFRRENIC